METILLLIFLSWIISAIMSSNKKKKQQRQQQQQQMPGNEEKPQSSMDSWRSSQTKGFGYAALNPFAEAFHWAEEEQTVDEPVSDVEYAEGECYGEQHQHGVYVQETKWSTMDELSVSSFESLDSNFVEAPKAVVNKPVEPVVEAQSELPNGQFAFIHGRSDVIAGIIWSEILSRPQERMTRRYARRF